MLSLFSMVLHLCFLRPSLSLNLELSNWVDPLVLVTNMERSKSRYRDHSIYYNTQVFCAFWRHTLRSLILGLQAFHSLSYLPQLRREFNNLWSQLCQFSVFFLCSVLVSSPPCPFFLSPPHICPFYASIVTFSCSPCFCTRIKVTGVKKYFSRLDFQLLFSYYTK